MKKGDVKEVVRALPTKPAVLAGSVVAAAVARFGFGALFGPIAAFMVGVAAFDPLRSALEEHTKKPLVETSNGESGEGK